MSLRSTLALLLLAGCVSLVGAQPAADGLHCPSGPTVFWDGQAPVPGVCAQVDALVAHPPPSCPAKALAHLPAFWTAVEVRWRPDPFDCGRSVQVHGCAPGGGLVLVGAPAALGDELGHFMFAECFGRSGEHTQPDGKVERDSDFDAWLTALSVQTREVKP